MELGTNGSNGEQENVMIGIFSALLSIPISFMLTKLFKHSQKVTNSEVEITDSDRDSSLQLAVLAATQYLARNEGIATSFFQWRRFADNMGLDAMSEALLSRRCAAGRLIQLLHNSRTNTREREPPQKDQAMVPRLSRDYDVVCARDSEPSPLATHCLVRKSTAPNTPGCLLTTASRHMHRKGAVHAHASEVSGAREVKLADEPSPSARGARCRFSSQWDDTNDEAGSGKKAMLCRQGTAPKSAFLAERPERETSRRSASCRSVVHLGRRTSGCSYAEGEPLGCTDNTDAGDMLDCAKKAALRRQSTAPKSAFVPERPERECSRRSSYRSTPTPAAVVPGKADGCVSSAKEPELRRNTASECSGREGDDPSNAGQPMMLRRKNTAPKSAFVPERPERECSRRSSYRSARSQLADGPQRCETAAGARSPAPNSTQWQTWTTLTALGRRWAQPEGSLNASPPPAASSALSSAAPPTISGSIAAPSVTISTSSVSVPSAVPSAAPSVVALSGVVQPPSAVSHVTPPIHVPAGLPATPAATSGDSPPTVASAAALPAASPAQPKFPTTATPSATAPSGASLAPPAAEASTSPLAAPPSAAQSAPSAAQSAAPSPALPSAAPSAALPSHAPSTFS
jgi:hypothetical protein